jgi:acetolactate synthase-1/2/3 large subunit
MGPKPIYCHHEQAAGFAAVGYARTAGFGACIVTTGPGCTNALTPLLGAWQDSIPCLFISGQTRSQHTQNGSARKVRQIGTQEANIIDVVKPWTVFALECRIVNDLEHILQGAYTMMTKERPGPAWISLPIDVQYATTS